MNLNRQLIEAATNGDLEKVKISLRQGADIHARNDEAVRNAAINGHLVVVHFLYKKGADIRAADDDSPEAALRWAAHNGHFDVVRFLCEKGADIHATDWMGPDGALCWAALNDRFDVVRFLVNPRKYGLDREGCDRNILAQKYPKVLVQIQQLEQQELYQNARVMYYTLSFAQQNKYGKGGLGALVQALQESLC